MQQYINSIDRYLSGINQDDYELEIRFGEFRGRTFIHNESKVFYTMLRHFTNLSDIYEYIPQSISLLTIAETGKEVPKFPDVFTENIYNLRETRIREAFIDENSPKFYSLKKNITTFDNTAYYQRFSVSKEEELGEKYTIPAEAELQAIRHKRRWSFAVNKDLALKSETFQKLKCLRIDFTHVTGWFINNNGEKENVNNFEIEAEIVKKPVVFERDIMPGITFLLQIYQSSNIILSSYQKSSVITEFNKFFEKDITKLEAEQKSKLQKSWSFNRQWKLFNPVNKPTNLKFEQLENVKNFAITDKADGDRKLLFILPDGIYLVYPSNDVTKISNIGIPDLTYSLLDGEYVVTKEGENVYLIFDVLIYKSQDVRKNSLLKRLNLLDSARFPDYIKIKKFFTEKFYKSVNDLLDEIERKPYKNDGIIINQINGEYSDQVYKWKPPQLLTIDFLVEKVEQDKYKLFLKSGNHNELFVGSKSYPFSGIIQTSEPLNTGQIVEMTWKDGTFIPYKIRYDRDQPNNLKTALSIWEDIMKPIEEATIRGLDLTMLRYFHNIIKKKMLRACENNNIVDIGSGRGGDLHKWRHINTKVLAVEPSLENIQEFKKRLEQTGYKFDKKSDQWIFGETHVKILNEKGENSENIIKTYNRTFNLAPSCITIFNALTFFFKDESTLDGLINTIDGLLPIGGTFMGMVMDGEQVKNLLNGNLEIDELSWKLTVKGKITDKPYGNKIYIDLIDTIVKQQEEYLVDFKELTRKLAEKKIMLQETEILTNENLGSSQKKLYKLYRTFKFKKSTEQLLEQEVISEDVIDNMKNIYVSLSAEHLQYLKEDERDNITIMDKSFIRIGTESDCMLTAIARSVFEYYQAGRNDIEKPLTKNEKETRKKYITILVKKILPKIKMTSDIKKYFDTWEEAEEFLTCNKFQWLNLIDIIGDICGTNIVYIKYFDSIRKPEITYTNLTFKRTAVILSHDNQFNSIGKIEDGKLITSFSKNPFI